MKNADYYYDYNDDDNDNDDTHQGWIIVRDGKYSVADKNDGNCGPRRNAGGLLDGGYQI